MNPRPPNQIALARKARIARLRLTQHLQLCTCCQDELDLASEGLLDPCTELLINHVENAVQRSRETKP